MMMQYRLASAISIARKPRPPYPDGPFSCPERLPTMPTDPRRDNLLWPAGVARYGFQLPSGTVVSTQRLQEALADAGSAVAVASRLVAAGEPVPEWLAEDCRAELLRGIA
jgi:hypothetical protein